MLRIFSFILFTGILVNSANAVGNIHLGRVEFHPYLETMGTYTSNLTQTKENALSSFIAKNSVGLGAFWPGDVHLLKIDYGLNIFTFSKLNYDKKSFIKNSANIGLDLNFSGGLFSEISDIYLETLSPASGEEAGIIERIENTGNFIIGYNPGARVNFSVSYMNVLHDYKLSVYNTLDRMEQYVGPLVYVKLMNKTSLVVDYKFGAIGYKYSTGSISKDSTQHDIMIGITEKINSKLTYEVKGGVELRNYNDLPENDFSTPIAGLSLIFQPSALWGIDLKFLRRAYESNWATNYYFLQNKTDLGVNWYPVTKITLTLRTGYEFNQYTNEESNPSTGSQEKRTDGVLPFGIDITYDIKSWLKTNFGYSLRSRSSNFDQWDYSENRISLAILIVL